MDPLYIVWQEEHNLGIPIIDEQHRGLVSTINTLYYYVSKGAGMEAIEPTLGILDHYIKGHFDLEEALMKKSGYPGYFKHAASHQELKNETASIVKKAWEHDDPYMVVKFLKNWWVRHINEDDREYVPWLMKS